MKQQVIIHFYLIFSGTKSGLWLCLSILLFLSPSFPVSAQTENQLLKTVPSFYQRGESPPDTLRIIEHKKKKFGVVNQQNEFIVPPVYKSISKIDPDCFLVEGKRKRYGLYNSKGKMILPVEYSAIHFFDLKYLGHKNQSFWPYHLETEEVKQRYIYHLKKDDTNIAVGFMNNDNWEPIFHENIDTVTISLLMNFRPYIFRGGIKPRFNPNSIIIKDVEYEKKMPLAYSKNGLVYFASYNHYPYRLISPSDSSFLSVDSCRFNIKCSYNGTIEAISTSDNSYYFGYKNFVEELVLPVEYNHFYIPCTKQDFIL